MKPSKVIPNQIFAAASSATAPVETGGKYDELVIRWNDLPRDTLASIYCPDWQADEILQVVNTLRRGPQSLTKVDANTIACAVGDISYIPIPASQQPMPALLTLKLPLDVRDGQQFRIDVQQSFWSNFRDRVGAKLKGSAASLKSFNFSARKVLGAFRVTVAVKIGEPLLAKLVRNLAVLRYIFEAIPPSDSWHPVFVRYIGQLSDQVKGLGVDPDLVPASADDPGIPGRPDGKGDCLTGKVAEVVLDCFGHFEGFVLETCECHRHPFQNEERGLRNWFSAPVQKAC